MEIEMFSKEWELVVTVTAVWDRKKNEAGHNQWLSMYDHCGLMVQYCAVPRSPNWVLLGLKGPGTRRRHSGAPNHWIQLLLS